MPYIERDARIKLWSKTLEPLLSQIRYAGGCAPTPGDINYLVTRIVDTFLGERPGYTHFNAAIGILESAKLELYRRLVAPYEDTKIQANGDVYEER